MRSFLLALEWMVLLYFVVAHLGPIVRNLLAIARLRRIALRPLEDLPPAHPDLQPPVSLVIAARDDEATIVGRVKLLLQLDYPEFEIVVVNDGSADGTLVTLQQAFDLEAYPEAYWRRIPTQPLHAVYRSRTVPILRVLDKEPGGMADALNAGINVSRYPLFCPVDAGAILLRDGLRRLVEPFVQDPGTVATRAAARISEGCAFANGKLQAVELPGRLLGRVQVLESLRAMPFGRLGWGTVNGAIVAPASLAVFRKDPVVEARGYHADAIAGDTELLVRVHHLLRSRGEACSIHFVADPICWTEVPATALGIAQNRIERQQGLAQVLHANGDLLRTGGGLAGRLAYGSAMLFECYGPLIEVAGYLFMAAMWLAAQVTDAMMIAFLVMAFSLGFLVSLSGLLLEELTFRLYGRFGQAGGLAFAALVENLGYRQFVSVARAIGVVRWLRGRRVSQEAAAVAWRRRGRAGLGT
ncbi:MAG TPA: glycosyltransferase [Usitatibacter sp.]|nr:glycosyltransferase [Usitatibacter sp.]